MGKSRGQEMEVTDYRMSLHYGICAGPVDRILGISVGEKVAWTGDVDAQAIIPINQPDLFGGIKKEGGPVGTAFYLPGGDEQLMPNILANKLGRTSETCPAYRGICSVFFYGSGYGGYYGYSGGGFLWGTNNPYLRNIWFQVQRSPKALPTALRMIGAEANPAAIIYECLVDRDWGMGASDAIIDIPSFEAAAQALADEEFGLSMMWSRQTTIEAFVSEVIDHIQATLFVNPRTGKLTLKLIRADYDEDDLPTLDENNCSVTSFDRKAWGETVNEIVVSWTNPENEQDETVVAQDLANITIQGSVISDSRNYYGVRNAELAMRLAKRDIATSSAPLATFEIDVDRSAWDFVPGGVFKLNYPEYGIEGLVLRISKIDYGKPGQPVIKINCMEDVFGLPSASYSVPDETQWTDPSADPAAINVARIITTPAYFMSSAISAGDSEALAFPEVFPAILASQNTLDSAVYDVVQTTVLPNGDVVGEVTSTKPILGHCITVDVLPAESVTTIPSFPLIVGGTVPSISGFLFIGGTSELFQEICLIQSFSEDGWLVKRGVLDTIPRTWPAGTPIWFVSRGTDFIDLTQVRSASETVRYKLLPRTSRGVLSQEDAPVIGVTLSGRPHLPLRPANVQVNGVSFGALDVSGAPPASVTVTWANRNRLLEDTQVLGWGDGTIAPEAGQTTSVVLLRGGTSTVLARYDGLTGTSFTLPLSDWADAAIGDVVVLAQRDGLESLQSYLLRVKVRPFGFGDDWGDDWGGSDTGYVPPIDPPTGGGGGDPDPGTPFPQVPQINRDNFLVDPLELEP